VARYGHRRLACGLAACLLALSPAAPAGTFSISPLRADLSGSTKTAALTVRNEDATPLVVQAEGMAWSQPDGEDTLAASRDLLVSPAVFTLAPGGQQLVRVALRRAPDPARELSYRLIVQEVPQAAAPQFNGLRMALRLSIPVFVAADRAGDTALQWTAERDADGALAVIARNDGAVHARIQRFAVRSGTDTVVEQPSLAYVLPGASRRWSFAAPTGAGAPATPVPLPAGPYRLEALTDRGTIATELLLTRD
jgi:fimbrial chaperone protein